MVSNAAKTQRYACGGMSLGPCRREVPGGLGLGSFSDIMDVEGPRGLEVQGWEQGPELGLGLRPTDSRGFVFCHRCGSIRMCPLLGLPRALLLAAVQVLFQAFC